LKNKVIVSIIAGKTIGFIEKSLWTDTWIVKIMPNLAIEYKKSVTAFCSNHRDSITESIRNDLWKLWKVIELEEEKFDSFTAVFWSGPAFLLEILKPFQSKINELWLSDREGGELLEELLGGTFEYFSNRKEKSMNNLIDSITSKWWVTQAGLECFNSKGGHKLIENILSTAENKTKEFRKDIDD
jgi:pyrroline-5-carboxylate reductase